MNTTGKTTPISSFAAPTAADVRAFDTLAHDAKRELVLAEIDKGFVGAPVALSDRSLHDILRRAQARKPVDAPE